MKPLPAVSAVASWVDNFKLPLREIKAKYTKSDLTILSWNSRLQSYNMSLGMKGTKNTSGETKQLPRSKESDDVVSGGVTETEVAYTLPEGVNNGVHIRKKFFNEEGDIDLRKVNGDEAAGYLRALGISLPVLPRMLK